MDDKTIFNEILGQVAMIVQQQTNNLAEIIKGDKGNSQKVDIVISGNSMSLLDTICNDAETAKKIEGVAASFNILNQELENYEKVFKGINEIKYSGAGGQIQYIVDFLNLLTDANYVSKLGEVNRILSTQKTSISDFFNTFANDELIGRITSFNDVYKITENTFSGLVDFLGKFDSLTPISQETVSNINSIVSSLGLLTQDEIVNRFGKAINILNKENASKLGDFFTEFNSKTSILDFNENKKAVIGGLLSVLNYLGSNEIGRNLDSSLRIFTKDNADSLADFFVEFSSRMNGVMFGEDKSALIGGLTGVINYLGNDKIDSSLLNTKKFFTKDNADSIADFFVEFATRLNGVMFGEDKIGLVGGLTGVVNCLGKTDLNNSLMNTKSVFTKENADSIADFFTEFSNRINGVVFGTDKAELIGGMTGIINLLGKKEMNSVIGNAKNNFTKENADTIADFFTEFATRLNGVMFGQDRVSLVSGLTGVVNYLAKDEINGSVRKSLGAFTKENADTIADFFVEFATKMNGVLFGTDKIELIGGMTGIINSLGENKMGEVMSKVNNIFTKENADSIADFFVEFATKMNGVLFGEDKVSLIGGMSGVINTLGKNETISSLNKVNTAFTKDNADSIADFFVEFATKMNGIVIGQDKVALIGGLTGVVNYLGKDEINGVVSKVRQIFTKENADTIADFFVEFATKMNSIVIGQDKVALVGGLTGVINYLGGTDVDKNLMNSVKFFNTENAKILGDFFVSFSEIFKRIEFGENSQKVVSDIISFVNILGRNDFDSLFIKSVGLFTKENATKLAEFFVEFGSQMNNASLVNEAQSNNLKYILSVITALGTEGFGDVATRAKNIFKKEDANSIASFFSEFANVLSGIASISEEQQRMVKYAVDLINNVGSDMFAQRLTKSLEILTNGNANSIASFFTELSSKMNVISSINNQGLNDIIKFIGMLGSVEFLGQINEIKTKIDATTADAITAFFIEFSNRLNNIPTINTTIGDILSVISNLMDKFSSTEMIGKLSDIKTNLKTEDAKSIGDFFVKLSSLLNGISVISQEQKQSLGYIRSLINMMGDGQIGTNITNALAWTKVENALEFGKFFVELTKELNQIPSVSAEQNNCIKYVLELLKYVGQDNVLRNIENVADNMNISDAVKIGDFFASFAESLSEIPSDKKEQQYGVEYILSILKFVGGEGVGKNLDNASKRLSPKVGKQLGGFFQSFAETVADSTLITKDKEKGIGYILKLLDFMGQEGMGRRLAFSSIWYRQMVAKSIGNFFTTFADIVSESKSIPNDKIKGINTILKLIQTFGEDGFAKKLNRASKNLSGKKGQSLGNFFQKFANEIVGIDTSKTNLSKLQPILEMIEEMASIKFITKLAIANKFFGGEKPLVNPTKIPHWLKQFYDEFGKINTGKVKSISSLKSFIDEVASVAFITKIAFANKFYGDNAVLRINPTKIPNWFSEFANAFNTMTPLNKNQINTLKSMKEFISDISGIGFLTKLVVANIIYKSIDPKNIANFYSGLITGLSEALNNPTKINTLRKNIHILKDMIEDLISASFKVLVLGVVGLATILAIPGLVALRLSMMLLFCTLDYVVMKMTQDRIYRHALRSFAEVVLELSVSLVVITAAMLLAENIGEGAWKIVFPLMTMLAIFGLVVVLDKIQKTFGVTEAILSITVSVLLLSTAILALTAAMVLANKIEGKGMVGLLAVLGCMVIVVGILALIQLTGIGPMAALAGIAIAGVMLVMSVVMMITLKVLQMASSAVKDLPKIKMLIVGLTDIMWDIAGKAALIGIVSPLIALFTISTAMVLVLATLAVAVGKIARLWSPKDKIALKNVIQGMIDIFDMVDEYFASKTTGSGIPVLGSVMKLWNALGAGLSLIIFTISLGVLMMVVTLTMIVMKMSRLIGPKDINSLKDVIGGMMDIFGMIDDFFASKTTGSSIPLIGTVLKTFNALGAGLALITFSVSLGVLMSVVTLTIGVMKLSKLVKKQDIEGLKGVVQGMIDIFDMVGGTFLFGLLDNISKAASTGLFAAAMTPILALTSWYISVIRKYYDADKQLGGLGKVSRQLVTDFKGFMDKINDSFGIMDGIANMASTAIVSSMIPMMKAIGEFVDIVSKVATMTFMTGYDSNGKPVYRKLPATAFGDAANTISTGFNSFMTELKTTFTNIKGLSTDVMEEMGLAMIPLMDSMSSYVDSVVKLATAQVTVGYDSNGKPKFKQLDFSETGDGYKAASTLGTLFTSFVKNLVTETNTLKIENESALKTLSEAMMPLMLGVSSFTEAIVKLGSAMIPDQWDKEGKPVHFKNVPSDVYTNAAQILANNFGAFIEVLRAESDKMMGSSKDETECLSKCMGELMTGIGSFADAIVKIGTAGTPIFDNKGNIVGWEKIDAQSAANALIGPNGMFSVFMSSLKTGFEGLDGETKESIKLLSDAMEPLMLGISAFADSIIKMATGTYIEGYDKDGKPITKLIPIDRYKTSAEAIASNFATFVLTLREKLFNTKGAVMQTLDALNKGGVAEVMKAVGNFIDAISKYTSGKMFVIEGFTKDGKPIYKKEKGKLVEISMSTVATNIANGFADFVSTMSSKLNDSTLINNIEQSKSVIEQLDDLMSPVSDFADTILKFKDNNPESFGQIGTALGQGLINVIMAIDGNDGKNNLKLLTTYGTEDISNQIEFICGSIDNIMDSLEDVMDAKETDSLTTKASHIGTAAITLLKSVNGENEDIKTYGSDTMTENIYKLTLNIKTLLEVMEDFDTFSKYDFVSIKKSEDDFAKAVRTLMTIDFQTFEPKFAASVNKTIQNLNNLDKKFNGSINATSKFKDTVGKAIDSIENKLSQNEKKRNEKFATLSQNLQTIADKLSNVQKGLNNLKNMDFKWVENLGKQIAKMEGSQESLQNSIENAKSISSGQRPSTQNGLSAWDGKTAVPVVLVNGATDNQGRVTAADGGVAITFDFRNTSIQGKMFTGKD